MSRPFEEKAGAGKSVRFNPEPRSGSGAGAGAGAGAGSRPRRTSGRSPSGGLPSIGRTTDHHYHHTSSRPSPSPTDASSLFSFDTAATVGPYELPLLKPATAGPSARTRSSPRRSTTGARKSVTASDPAAAAAAFSATATAPLSARSDKPMSARGMSGTLGLLRSIMGEPKDDPLDGSAASGDMEKAMEVVKAAHGEGSAEEALAAAQNLKTGEDAIAYFSRYGAGCPVKFVHLNRARTGDVFRPYDLVVVAQEDVDPEYFTMSASGVVHISPDAPSEFISLAEWMRQATHFNLLTSIPFYRNYLIGKSLRLWRSNIRYNLYCQQRAQLSRKLFLAKPAFCKYLLEINRHISQLHSITLLELKPQQRYEIDAFQEMQTHCRTEAAKKFEIVLTKVQHVVERVCTDVSRRARATDAPDADGAGARGADKSKSMMEAKLEVARRARALKRAAAEEAMLGAFIRLVDYMCVEQLVAVVIEQLRTFLTKLRDPDAARKTGLFQTAVRFTDADTTFEPTAQEYHSMFDIVTDSLVTTATSALRIAYARPFKLYVSELPSEEGKLSAPSVAKLLAQSQDFRAIRAGIVDKFTEDFEDAAVFVKVFDAVRPIYEFQWSNDLDKYKTDDWTVATIKADMNKFREWEKELDKMRLQNTTGCLYVESKRLKGELQPITDKALEGMKELLKDISRDKCKEALTAFSTRAKALNAQPQYLKDFAGHLDKVQTLRSDEKRVLKVTAVVEEMYKTLTSHDVKIPSEDSVQLDDMRASQVAYVDAAQASEAFIEERKPEMTHSLDMSIIKLNEQLGATAASLNEGQFVDAMAEPAGVLAVLDTTAAQMGQMEEMCKTYNKWQALFGFPPYEFKNLRATQQAFKYRHQLWASLHQFNTKYKEWTTTPFLGVDCEQVVKDTALLLKTAFVLDKKLADDVSANFKDKMANFKTLTPMILELGNPAMRPRHWAKLFKAIGHRYVEGNDSFTLDELMRYDVFAHKELISETSGTASGEAQLEASLEKVATQWAEAEFVTKNYREMRHVYILGGLDDIFTLLEDNQVLLQTMMGSRYIKGVQAEVESWDKKLSLLSDTLDEWIACQRSWMYLETIFSAEDIQRQLPAEAAKFQQVDKRWREAMLRTHNHPNVIDSIEGGDELLQTFQHCNTLLEEIQKSLEDYLETKRSAFPRFYFLSNDELLQILSQTRDPRAVQPHMSKCFDSIASIDFGEDADAPSNAITAMNSVETEKVTFSTAVQAIGNVENWLSDVESMMRTTLYDLMRSALDCYPPHADAIDRSEWMFEFPAQNIIAVDQVMWTRNCATAIGAMAAGTDKDALAGFLRFTQDQITSMVALVRSELTKLQRRLMGSMIVIDVHARDVVAEMVRQGVDSLDNFEWTRQLRYYWEEDVDNVVIRQTNTRFVYGYEYLGNSMRLVITPLTDKCYMTLTGALHLRFGGAPAGPAGTGKTETVKDLAKALSMQCVVFNCSDGLDFRMMGRFFAGLAQAGAWSCFDEFNRIDIEVLSVIAQQILTIQQGLISKAPAIEFEGRTIKLSGAFGVFITMNPGYAGRTELPDNLKALFRPVAMMVPDYRMIAEIILFSQGFADALPLSNKMTQLYKLSSEQLSKQDHYDFGMRAVKSVLVAAGQLKRKEPDVNENILLIRAMRDSNVPKFLEHDLPLFYGIMADLFPGVEVPYVDYGKLQEAIENQLYLAGLQQVPSLVSKIIQVHETQLVRHGMMVVGETGSGKTTNLTTLANAITQLKQDGVVDKDGFFKTVQRYILNPKALRMGELYGEFNEITNEWTDGLVALLVRQAREDKSDNRKWLLFDGPVDTLWIENMNTVLDDNKMLCLANGERIKLPDTMHITFEVQDLAVASPATVSRCGMVYMEPVHVGLVPIIDTWAAGKVEDLLPELVERLVEQVKEHVPVVIKWIRQHTNEVIPSSDYNLLQSFLHLLDTLLTPEHGVRGSGMKVIPRSSAQKRADAEAERRAALGEQVDGKEEEEEEEDDDEEDGDGGDEETKAGGVDDSKEADDTQESKLGGGGGGALDDDDDDDDLDGLDDMDLGLGGGDAAPSGAMSAGDLDDIVNAMYVFAFTWSFGCNLDDNSRNKFNDFASALLSPLLPEAARGEDLFGLYVDEKTRAMRPWTDCMRPFSYNPDTKFFDIVVPTADTTRYSRLLELLLGSGRHVLFAGETGVGKSVIASTTITEMTAGDRSRFVSASVNFSAQTSSANLQEVFETKLDKKRKNRLGPPSGKTMILFIDDLNMPALDLFGSQPPIELLRQVVGQGGFYDRQKLFFKWAADCVFASALAPPGGGRNEVTPRLTQKFHLMWLTNLSEDSMKRIFNAIFQGFLAHAARPMVDHAPAIVEASVGIYSRVTTEMLPTPTKSHYTFNLRDLSKVFQGVMMTHPSSLGELDDLLKVWLHEAARVFRDRLINDADRSTFNGICSAMMQTKLSVDMKPDEFSGVLMGDYLSREQREYRLVRDPPKLPALFAEYLDEYNVSFPNQMHLVFFTDAIAHLSRVARILRQPRGSALLVGVGGSGRQSLARLAAFVADFPLFTIEITRVYGMNEFHEDIKKMMLAAGTKDQDVVFLFSETQIVKEAFLEDLNNILNSGDVPNLYAPDEMETIINDCRAATKAAGKLETRDSIFAHYVQTVRERLHVVLAFSPIGASFRNRCRMFPSLINCCTIDWFNAWPEDALFSVAQTFLSKGSRELGIEDTVEPLCKMCVKLHMSVADASAAYLAQQRRHNYTTPTSYLELIRLYTGMLTEQRDIVTGKAHRYKGGLQKLNETNVVVEKLQDDLRKLQPVLVKAAEDTATLLVQLEKDQKDADAAAAVAAKDEAETAEVAKNVATIKADCQKDLDEALPAYYSALKALDSLDKKQIQEVKAYAKPPRLVEVVLSAVCLLLDKKETWEDGKKLMSDMNFLQTLKEYDKDNIDPKKIRKLGKYMKDPDFHPDKIQTVSTAATSLCMWVRAMHVYDRVARNIEPKRKKLAEAEAQLAEAQGILDEKRKALRVIQKKVADLQKMYSDSLAKRDSLKAEQKQTTDRLDRAHKLTGGLGDEAVRWEAAAQQLDKDLVNLVGNVLLAAGCVAYVGPFNNEFRIKLVRSWVKQAQELDIPVDPQFSLTRILADPVTVREWNIMGLPADDFSTQNGLLATLGRRWPLMIDPQGQANRWVKNLHKDEGLKVIKLTDGDFLRTLENAIRFGQPVLLENVEEELDPGLEPILLKQTFKKGGQLLLHLGDSDVPYSEEFKLYITTKLPNPHYMPEVCIRATLVNFTVTLKGLEDQLLVDVVRFERPDLEKRKDKLIVSIASDKRQLQDIEDKILQMLADASGDILDDEELIESLAASKTTSEAISVRMREAEATSKEINETRELYRPVATRGSILYFVIADMTMVDIMYQYSLQAFTRLYNMRIEKSEKSDVLADRLEILINDLTTSFYTNVCRGLFEVHKLLYSFLIAAQILRNAGEISTEDWGAFVVGSLVKDDATWPQPDGLKAWMDNKTWLALLGLVELDGLREVLDHMAANPAAWGEFAASWAPGSPMPDGYSARLKPFHVLLVTKALREEKTVFVVRSFVERTLGHEFTEPPPFDLEGGFNDSTAATPLIFVLSPGADPVDYLLKLAKDKGKAGPGLRMISLGQGQGPIAESMMEAARRSGDWVCLQNCHLAVSWLPRLEQILEQTCGTDEHRDYRLWLTSMPSPAFPVPVLQNSIKLTQEPPRGLKANLTRTFADVTEEEYEACSKPRPFKKLLFGLAWYHAICLERRAFGPVGWNIPYEFMTSDLKTGMMQLRMYIEEQATVPYVTLNSVIGDITYGGRCTDKWDKRTNLSILTRYFTPEVMDDSYRFSDSGAYYAPPEGTLDEVRAYIDGLPQDDPPETFGLHDNANITLEQKVTKDLMATIVSMQPRATGSAGGRNPDDIVDELATEIESRLPAPFSKDTAHPDTFATIGDGSVNSLGVFAEQEMVRFNTLIKVMKASLGQLKKAIKGLVVMSSQLEEMHQCFMFQRVPPTWEAAAYPCLKPLGSWVEDLFQRLETLKSWLVDGPPASFWISGFFFPQGFMTGALQTYSRKTKIAIDTLGFRTQVMKYTSADEVGAAPKDGVYIHGLFLEAAKWDSTTETLAESNPGELLFTVPVVWLEPILVKDLEAAKKHTYDCPVYKTSTRAGTLSTTGHSTNFVLSLALRMPPSGPGSTEEHYVRRGAAMLCMTSF